MLKTILVLRFSALGDVALTVPVLEALAKQYPDLDITMLSRGFCRPLFERLPQNVHFVAADLNGAHKGLSGLNRLLKEMDFCSYDYVADLHDVLRTKWLRFRFCLAGKKTAKIDKGRAEKKALVRAGNKHKKQLRTSFERYADVFAKLGFPVKMNFVSLPSNRAHEQKKEGETWIGVAPFAKHQGKIYPLEKTERVVEILSERENTKIFLFGASEYEESIMKTWSGGYRNVSIPELKGLGADLDLMAQLDVMFSMDSANMHLASLMAVPVVSVWGATHPYAGFLGWNQKLENCVQLDMKCRPCSVFGNKPCKYGDYRCMNKIAPEQVVEKILANVR